MQHYSEDFKQAIIKKCLLPGGPSLRSIAIENGLVITTVYGRKKKYATQPDMNKKNKRTPEQKFQALIETSSLSEHELGEYLRKNGLHLADLEQWKQECKLGMKGAGRPKINSEVLTLRKEQQSLQKDLNRKNTALAEMSARVILLKKSHSLFEDPEDDE
jgi:transposase